VSRFTTDGSAHVEYVLANKPYRACRYCGAPDKGGDSRSVVTIQYDDEGLATSFTPHASDCTRNKRVRP
jgi:hypothetical protein